MNEEPTIVGVRGVLVKAGLGTPPARAFVAGTVIGVGAYLLRQPRCCFDEEGQMRPLSLVSSLPTATHYHFLAVPVTAAVVAYLFT